MLEKRKYIWEWPVRVTHWLNVPLILILFITGYYIGKPIMSPVGDDPGEHFLMGYIRYIHIVAAWVFAANLLVRAYWALAGNDHAHFRPWRKGFFGESWETIKYYAFLRKKNVPHAGSAPLAQLSYFLFLWVGSFIMLFTGIALIGEIHPLSIQAKFFGWMMPLFNGSFTIRSLHHVVAWSFIWFFLVHLYMVFRQDILDRDGTISSMVSGYKHFPAKASQEEPTPMTGVKANEKNKRNRGGKPVISG